MFRIPCSLREHCGGLSEVAVQAGDLASALAELEARYPGCRDRIAAPSGHLRQFVRVLLNDREVSEPEADTVRLRPADRISILPAVVGG